MKKIGKNLADKSRLLSKFLMVLFFILLLGCSDQDSDLTKGFSSNQKSDQFWSRQEYILAVESKGRRPRMHKTCTPQLKTVCSGSRGIA